MELLFAILVFLAAVFVVRLFGAWMFRINELIDLLKDIKGLLMDNRESEKSATHIGKKEEPSKS